MGMGDNFPSGFFLPWAGGGNAVSAFGGVGGGGTAKPYPWEMRKGEGPNGATRWEIYLPPGSLWIENCELFPLVGNEFGELNPIGSYWYVVPTGEWSSGRSDSAEGGSQEQRPSFFLHIYVKELTIPDDAGEREPSIYYPDHIQSYGENHYKATITQSRQSPQAPTGFKTCMRFRICVVDAENDVPLHQVLVGALAVRCPFGAVRYLTGVRYDAHTQQIQARADMVDLATGETRHLSTLPGFADDELWICVQGGQAARTTDILGPSD